VLALAALVAQQLGAQTSVTYGPSGVYPSVLTFDGTYLWVVNGDGSYGDSVTKFLPSTGVTVGTYPTGSRPISIIFDGTYIWIANSGSNNLTKLLASTGNLVGTYPVGVSPASITFDGSNIWVSVEQNGIAFDGTNIWAANGGSVTKLLASTGAIVGKYPTATGVGEYLIGVTKLLASTGAIVGTYPTGSTFPSIIFDGTNIWVTNGGSVTKLLASTGATLGIYNVGGIPFTVAFDGANIWVLNIDGSGAVTELQASTGALVATYFTFVGTPPPGAILTPIGIAFGGDNMWVADSLTNTLTKINDNPQAPFISPGGVVPLDGTTSTIQPNGWVSIYGGNLAYGTTSWNGNFPTSLGGVSVQINGKAAYLSYVSPGQINLQAPDDTTNGTVSVAVTSTSGNVTSTVTLGEFAPSFALLDSKHVAGIILRSNGSGAYGGGTYDILGPTGTSLGYPTVAARAGDTVELFGVGFGPTTPAVPAGQAFNSAAPTMTTVGLSINAKLVTPSFSGLSSAGLYQLNVTIPAGLGTGDLPLVATVGGFQTQSGVVISLQ
jgi:uncharacterized protein (TIGR03437 family)